MESSLKETAVLECLQPIKVQRKMWVKVRSDKWWDLIASQHLDEKDWVANFCVLKRTFDSLCMILLHF